MLYWYTLIFYYNYIIYIQILLSANRDEAQQRSTVERLARGKKKKKSKNTREKEKEGEEKKELPINEFISLSIFLYF